jgi:mRNA export factor
MNATKKNQDKDILFQNPPSDSISCLAINGTATTQSNIVVAGSWDNTLSCYEISYDNNGASGAVKQCEIKHDAPVLCCDFASDSATTFSGGCDGSIRMWNPLKGPTSTTVIGKHDDAVRCIKFLPESNLVVTGSWDKTVRLWDPRQPNAARIEQVGEKVFAMDAKGSFVIVGTADKMIHAIQVNNNSLNRAMTFKSPLDYQTRCISIFENNQGFALGSIEGRVAVEYYSEMERHNNKATSQGKPSSFVFKCHRHDDEIYSVNAIDFHRYNTFCTGGSDGVFSWWDKDARHRLQTFEKHKKRCPINALKFNPMGNLLVYSLSYDWSKGPEFNSPEMGNNICIHNVSDSEIQPKKTVGRR